MNNIQLSVVHRLPQSYRWLSGFTGVKVEPIPLATIDEKNNLMGLKLLSHDGSAARQVMQRLHLSLQEIQVDSAIVEWEGEPCLFVHCHDESAAMCRLKNVGVAIAEKMTAFYPF
ncbi:YejG family protein [Yersinia nurmii]|uniref:Cytoplasmic protein n=1 Tax=Yersinia nurmii TaxID=685706 RepID=A0AAW7K0T3_9GAMM|nr:YejG family protein [Yersinia nurmii]MDN0087032.1 YejG family protein [Yersinia nurmii]CNE15410.1 putative cytoplasmic protein [Yersinia nurmii]